MKKWMVIILTELLLLLVGIAGLFRQSTVVYESKSLHANVDEEEVVYLTDKIPLPAGVYKAVLTYQTQEDGVHDFGVVAEDELVFRGLRSNGVTLFSDKKEVTCEFYLLDSCKEFQAYVKQEDGTVLIEGVVVGSTNAGSRILIFWTVLCSLLINTFVWLYDRNAKGCFSKEKQIAMAGCVIITLMAALPLFVDYIILADGVVGNLAAIERVSNRLFGAGAEGNWFLVIPALLRKIGLSMNMAYRLFLWLLNVATVGAAYVSFYKGTGKEFHALALTAVWTLNPYRIWVLYEKADLLTGVWLVILPAGIASVLWFIFKAFGKKSAKKATKANIGVLLLVAISMLSVTYQTNRILVNGHPLWVYSMEDMVRADETGLTYLVKDTYGMNN